MDMYADLMLPVPLEQLFTYRIPQELSGLVVPGTRVYVPFGKNRQVTGITVRVHSCKPEGCRLKDIISVFDGGRTAVLPKQFELFKWISDYYMCCPGDVMKAALPGGLRPDSRNESRSFKPKTETFVRLGEKARSAWPANPDSLFSKTAGKQKEIFLRYLELSGYAEDGTFSRAVSKRLLTETCQSPTAMKALQNNGILEFFEVETGRLPVFKGTTSAPAVLNAVQQQALEDIHRQFKSKDVCLLHGVTSCGKTEIYIHLIREQLEQGRQVLYLLPEIALTTQIMHRLQRVFGNDMCVCHSRCSDNVRVEVWNRQAGENPYGLVLGARSAVMLPFRNLGLVIVDEEHEPSFKQEDPAPRYHGRNTAIMLATLCDAKTLLGSATPAIESYCNASVGKYGLTSITRRYSDIEMPAIEIVDTVEMSRKKYMRDMFSPQLFNRISEALSQGRQAILFHNRRGYAGVVECADCGWVQKCDCCDVSLTYHKTGGNATCHYCGRHYSVPPICPECGGHSLKGRIFGTEKIEEAVRKLFPGARTARLDVDSAKEGYEKIILDFQEGRTDILIGTQMVSKGLDFGNVGVVGIIQADSIMNFPDFRATERAYQLMSQVAGRAGRKGRRGTVVIQTRQPQAPVLQMLRSGRWEDFFNSQMEERRLFNYPPYSRLVNIWIRSRDMNAADSSSAALASSLGDLFGKENVLGPDSPAVQRVQLMYLRKIMVKVSIGTGPARTRAMIMQAADCLQDSGQLRGVSVSFDADPQ